MELKQKIRYALKRLSGIRLDRRVMVFLFFVFISALFWFLSALGREYTARINYPVRYTNFPEKMVLVNNLPDNFELTVNSYGYNLLRYYVTRHLIPIVIDVGSFPLNGLPGNDTRDYYLLSSYATARISGQLGAEMEILDIRPDTVFLSFSDMVSRQLPVKPVTEIEFDQQFMIKGGIGIDPDTILVSGPATVLDTMTFVPTMPLVLRGLNESVRKPVNLMEFDLVSYGVDRIWLDITVEQFTEASIRVPVEPVNLPDNLMMKTFPSAVTVSYMVALSDYDKIERHQFRAVADYNEQSIVSGRLPVRLAKYPDFIKSVRFYPQNADYIIEAVDKE